jgi:nitrogen regulatory protein P-II 1
MAMKKVEAFIRKDALKKVLIALTAIDYPGVTVGEVQGHGRQKGIKEHYRDQVTMSLLTKLKIEVVVNNAKEAKKVVDAIVSATRTGNIGDGKIFVFNVEQGIRIRTGEHTV